MLPRPTTLIASLTTREQRSAAFAMQRVTMNLGIGVGAMVGGFIANTAHPDTFVLLDLDAEAEVDEVLPQVLATGEAQAAVRFGTVLVPRLVRTTAETEPVYFHPNGTVLLLPEQSRKCR